MFLLARARSFLARHRWMRWAVVVALAAIAGWSVLAAMRGIDTARRQWGTSRRVYVATAAAGPGDELHVERRDVPLAVVPDDAVGSVPPDAVSRQRIGPGEVVTDADVGAAGTAEWVAPGEVALSVPVDGPPPVVVGDTARVFAGGDQLADGTVLRVDAGAVVVAVPEEAAASVSAAIAGSAAVLGRLGP